MGFSWSPNGECIAYSDSALRDTFVLPVHGGDTLNLTDFSSEEIDAPVFPAIRPLWSADSQSLFFKGQDSFWQVPLEGQPRKLMEKFVLDVAQDSQGNFAWTSDGVSIFILTHLPENQGCRIARLNLQTGQTGASFEGQVLLKRLIGHSPDGSEKKARIFY
jgi:hypothetical protein